MVRNSLHNEYFLRNGNKNWNPNEFIGLENTQNVQNIENVYNLSI